MLADALAASHDINLAASAAAADLVEQQALRWVAGLVGHDDRPVPRSGSVVRDNRWRPVVP